MIGFAKLITLQTLIMSSGFVSGGTTDQPLERDDEWRKAQHEIEVARKKKEDESRHEGGKSLYEVLQQNKGGYTRFSTTISGFDCHG